MIVTKHKEPGTSVILTEKSVLLSELKTNDLFRFVSGRQTFDEALDTSGSSFYRVIAQIGPAKTGEVMCVSLDGKSSRLFNDNHLVIQHEFVIAIKPAKTNDEIVPIPDESDKA